MAHFAKIENGKVVTCVVVRNEDCAGGSLPESEDAGKAFLAGLGFSGEWVQTSYNKNFRGQFAGIGMNWDGTKFYPDAPGGDYELQPDGTWEPTTPDP